MYINGEWKEAHGGNRFSSFNPATGAEIGSFPDGGAAETAEAIGAAASAFPAWSGKTAYERSEILSRAYRLMVERKDALARTMTEEQGKPVKAARGEVGYAADFLLWFAEEAKRVYGRTIPAPRADQRFQVLHHPIGVVGAITPWNYPISMITRKIAPATAAGCTVVLKAATLTPKCAVETFRVFHDAGFPPGVVNLVTGTDHAAIGDALIGDPRVRKITFTGSTEAGRSIASRAQERLKRVSLELGGHAPFIVFADADPVRAAKGLALLKYLNSGQACISPNRIYAHETILPAFLTERSSRGSKLVVGNGLEESVSVGPLMTEAALRKVDSQVTDAHEKGAVLHTGGRRLLEGALAKGFFYAPTVISGVRPDMRIYHEETFGPVAPVIAFGDGDDILALANDTSYGLASYVYTNRLDTAQRMMEGLEYGIIGINDINPTAVAAPFAGIKESGLGIEGSIEGIEEFLYKKTAAISLQ